MTAKKFAALFTVAFSVATHATTCFNQPPCGALRANGTMFLGTALRVRNVERPDPAGSTHLLYRRIFTFAVTEVFSGQAHAGQDVEIETEPCGDQCGSSLQLGESYFIDSRKNEGALELATCGNTAPAWRAQLVIAELRAAGKHGALPSLSGYVDKNDPRSQKPAAPVAGITVTATSAGGHRVTAITDENGIYRFPHLAPAAYTVQFSKPSELFTMSDKEHVVLPGGNGPAAVCHADFATWSGGTLLVHVVDRGGKPVRGHLSVSRWTEWEAPFPGWDGLDVGKKAGEHVVGLLPPQRYRIIFHRDAPYEPAFYFPGTTELSKAEPVTVEEGKATDVRLVVP